MQGAVYMCLLFEVALRCFHLGVAFLVFFPFFFPVCEVHALLAHYSERMRSQMKPCADSGPFCVWCVGLQLSCGRCQTGRSDQRWHTRTATLRRTTAHTSTQTHTRTYTHADQHPA